MKDDFVIYFSYEGGYEWNFSILGILAFTIVLTLVVNHFRKHNIQEKIKSIGGEIVSIEKRNYLTGIGPNKIVGRGMAVYRVVYQQENKLKEGWVKFGGFWGPDWKL